MASDRGALPGSGSGGWWSGGCKAFLNDRHTVFQWGDGFRELEPSALRVYVRAGFKAVSMRVRGPWGLRACEFGALWYFGFSGLAVLKLNALTSYQVQVLGRQGIRA